MISLIRLRKDVICLDSSLALTQGNPVGLSAALTQLHPARGSYTGVASSDDEDPNLIGQMVYTNGSRSAQLSFFAPGRAAASPLLTDLLEGLAWQAGNWGAFHLVGEIDELSPAFEALRRAGFSVYAWQRIWKLGNTLSTDGRDQPLWRPVSSVDEIAIRNLCQNLVPPLVQSAEPLFSQHAHRMAYWHDHEIMGYVNWTQGPLGLVAHPLVHPDLTDYGELIRSLVNCLPRLGRPVYLAVRSYQSWLENALSDLPAEVSPRHALLVKHLATLQRMPLGARLGVDPLSPEVPTASIINHFFTRE